LELVYLWVEGYKNINHQGFNFSPRFECEFDGENLTITENEDYVSIFPDNINITAIVGENGSGKSALFEILEERLINPKINILLFNNKEKKFYYQNFNIKQTNTNYKIESIQGNDYYDLNLSINILSSEENCKGDTENLIISKLSKIFEKEDNCFDFLDSKLIFKFWNMKFNSGLPSLNTNIKRLDKRYSSSIDRILNNLEKNKEELYLEVFVFVAVKFILYILARESLEKSKYFELLKKLSENFTKENYLNLVNSITLERLKDIGSYDLILETLQKFDESVLEIEKLIDSKQNINSFEITNFIKSGLYKTFHTFSNNNFKSKIIEIDFIAESDLHFSNLSSGEKQRINYCLLLAYDLIFKEEDKYLIRCYDERDVYIHPNWQRLIVSDFLNLINKYLKNMNETIHLLLTSHSPFILSDLPKENVIFLKNGKIDNPDIKQTFGANIHTLLSDGFFMSDGLMGEFAKGKITTILRFLNGKNKFINIEKRRFVGLKLPNNFIQKQIKPIIEIIGEDFLKQKLLDMYYKKFDKEARKKELEKEKARIEEELKKYD
jgi:predicted ATP-binding protein involved in virulence